MFLINQTILFFLINLRHNPLDHPAMCFMAAGEGFEPPFETKECLVFKEHFKLNLRAQKTNEYDLLTIKLNLAQKITSDLNKQTNYLLLCIFRLLVYLLVVSLFSQRVKAFLFV